jgi:acetylornithine/succinyldiaminopimelate/putrescine aminotransferase
MLAGFRYAKMNDIEGVKSLVDHETAAILIEPIQGEGGVRIPEPGFLQALRDLCDEHGLLLMFDEVQTGMGRTGTWFGYQQTGVQPDVLTMAKGIAAGVACGAMICRDEFAGDLRPGMHASTFGGNSLAMAAGLATGLTIEKEGILEHVQELAEEARTWLEALQQRLPIIREIRICGMMIGIDLSIPSAPAVAKCMERGVLINATNNTVVRLLPALNVPSADLMEGLQVVAEVLEEMANEVT